MGTDISRIRIARPDPRVVMHSVRYRNFGSYETLVGNLSVDVGAELPIPAIVSSRSGDREHRLRGRRSEATIVSR